MDKSLKLHNTRTVIVIRLVVVISLAFMCSCSSVQEKNNTFVSCKLEGSKITVEVDTFSTYKYCLSVGTVVVDSGNLITRKEFIYHKL